MTTWIALFRGINVGGRNIVPMAELRKLIETVNCVGVRTYIQSGNAVFQSVVESREILGKQIQDAVEREFNFRPALMLLSSTEFTAALDNNPFPQAADSPKTLHFFFLEFQPAAPDLDAIGKLACNTENFELIDSVFYLHAPDGTGRSKLAASVERKLGVTATARNFNTITRLSAMLSEAKNPAA